MYQDLLREIDGIGVFPMVSLVLFVVVFTVVVIHALLLDRAGVQYMAALPLDQEDHQ